MFRILFQDEWLVAIDKPSGFHVHPPEDQRHSISKNTNALALLRDQLQKYVYPVHRIDRATSGVLLYGLQPESARLLNLAFTQHQIQKTYFAVVRGWIKKPIRLESPVDEKDAVTEIRPISQAEFDVANDRYPTSRYSLVAARPVTGRLHQIRRHLAQASHPILGDTQHGKGIHNQIFRKQFEIHRLLLKAYSLRFEHPVLKTPVFLRARWGADWLKVFDLFGVCPLGHVFELDE